MRHSVKRFNNWMTERFDYVYENLEVETCMSNYNSLDDMQNNVVEEALDAIEVIGDWEMHDTPSYEFKIKVIET